MPADTTANLLARAGTVVVTGTYTTRYEVTSPPDNTTYDLRGARFEAYFDHDAVYEVGAFSGGSTEHQKNTRGWELGESSSVSGLAIVGGVVEGDQPQTLTWGRMKYGQATQDAWDAWVAGGRSGSAPSDTGTNQDGDPRFHVNPGSTTVVDGIRVRNSHDGLGMYGVSGTDGAGEVYVRNCWLQDIHDDAIENDEWQTLTVSDCLIERAYGFLSTRTGTSALEDGPGSTHVQTIEDCVIWLHRMPGGHEMATSETAHDKIYKHDTAISPPLVMNRVVIMVEHQKTGSSLTLPTRTGDSYSNVTIVWLGEGAYPGNVPTGVTVVTDPDVYHTEANRWKARHGVTDFDTVDMARMIAPSEASTITELASTTEGSSDPTYRTSQHHVDVTAGGRILVVHGYHGTGLRLRWSDDDGATWSSVTRGSVTNGVVHDNGTTGDRPASIAVAGTSAYVIWGQNSADGNIEFRRLSDLDHAGGPQTGAVQTLSTAGRLPDVAPIIGGVVFSWFDATSNKAGVVTDLTTDAPTVTTAAVTLTGTTGKYGSLITNSGDIAYINRGESSSNTMRLSLRNAGTGVWTQGIVGPTMVNTTPNGVFADSRWHVAYDSNITASTEAVSVQSWNAAASSTTTDLTMTGYADPTLATDGDVVVLLARRMSDGALISRTRTSAAWATTDVLEMSVRGAGGHTRPNLNRNMVDGRLMFVSRAPGASGVQSQVLFGTRQVVDAPSLGEGSATGSWAYVSTASGATQRRGTAGGSWGYVSSATGDAPGDVVVVPDPVVPPPVTVPEVPSYLFIPPTKHVRPMTGNKWVGHPAHSLFRHYRPNDAGTNIWLVDGVLTTTDPGDPDARVLLGGHHNVVTEAEAAVLTAAGYTVLEV